MPTARPRPLRASAASTHSLSRTRAASLGVALCVAMLLHAAPVAAKLRAADRTLAEAAAASLSSAASRMVDGTREVAMFALSLVGIGYRYGGETPDDGLDCSGLIRYVFQEVTGVTLPRTARELSHVGRSIPARELAPGDLVFFNTRHFPNSHVGIYLGDDRFIHAPSRGGEVGVATLSAQYWRSRYNGARRLVGVLPALVSGLIPQAHANGPDIAPADAQAPVPVVRATPAESSEPLDPISPAP